MKKFLVVFVVTLSLLFLISQSYAFTWKNTTPKGEVSTTGVTVGAGLGAGVGIYAGYFIGGIGVVMCGTGFGIPAGALAIALGTSLGVGGGYLGHKITKD